MDIFKDHNYSLEHAVQFLNCVLQGDPVKTVVAQEFVHQNENITSHTAQKSKEKKAKKWKETEDIPSEPSFLSTQSMMTTRQRLSCTNRRGWNATARQKKLIGWGRKMLPHFMPSR